MMAESDIGFHCGGQENMGRVGVPVFEKVKS
jgi:hypothetical protein